MCREAWKKSYIKTRSSYQFRQPLRYSITRYLCYGIENNVTTLYHPDVGQDKKWESAIWSWSENGGLKLVQYLLNFRSERSASTKDACSAYARTVLRIFCAVTRKLRIERPKFGKFFTLIFPSFIHILIVWFIFKIISCMRIWLQTYKNEICVQKVISLQFLFAGWVDWCLILFIIMRRKIFR